jgi:hypothetical protein
MRLNQPAEFEFVHATYGLNVLQGFVLCREDEMILDIEEPNNGRWNIRGKAKNGFFEGRHEGPSDDVQARAKWILLDDMYVGIWIEQGQEYLFKIRLRDSE